MTEELHTVDGVELCLETFGTSTDPALLLVGGMGASMDWWEIQFCEQLAAAGRFVIRYDHRDTGRSSCWPVGKPGYTGDDLAADAVRVLDAVGVSAAHWVGVSMGGGIAQSAAAQKPDRVVSLTLIATTAAGTWTAPAPLPPPAPRLAAHFENPLAEPDWSEEEAIVEYLVEDFRAYTGSLGLDDDRTRRVARMAVDRTRDMRASTTNHAVMDQGSTTFPMTDIKVPTLVLHGTDDPLLPFPHGEALAAEIAGARLTPLPGMGHQVPPESLWPVVIPAIVAHTAG